MRDLGVTIDCDMKFHSHAISAVSKANRVLSLISKSFVNVSPDMLPILYKSLVRPLLEYGKLIWGPFYILGQRLIENIQRRTTHLVPTVRHHPYLDRLRSLNLPSLSYHRKHDDMISLYQIFQGHIDLDISDLVTVTSYSSTRGHSRKLFKPRSSCHAWSKKFSVRAISEFATSERTINFYI